jgi:DNA gyrase subunit B
MPLPQQTELVKAVRKKPGMYIGGTDERALNTCVMQLVGNSVEQHLQGRCASLTLTLHDDGSASVQDDGPGISVRIDPQFNVPFIELALTTFNYQPEGHWLRPYRVFPAGVGAKCVNFVSEWMRITTTMSGEEFQIAFCRGILSEPLRKIGGPGATRGTKIVFKPDSEIFGKASFDRNTLAKELEPLAFLHPGFDVWLVDERPNPANRPLVSRFWHPNGIADYLRNLRTHDWLMRCTPVVINGELGEIRYAIGFQFSETPDTFLSSFVNSSPTLKGGTHVRGFLLGLTETLNRVRGQQPAFNSGEIRLGLSAVVGVWLVDPHYGGAAKDELINPAVEDVVRKATAKGVDDGLAEQVIDFVDRQRRNEQ